MDEYNKIEDNKKNIVGECVNYSYFILFSKLTLYVTVDVAHQYYA